MTIIDTTYIFINLLDLIHDISCMYILRSKYMQAEELILYFEH